MKKLRLERTNNVTFREGCERYLDDCRVRNLREGILRWTSTSKVTLN